MASYLSGWLWSGAAATSVPQAGTSTSSTPSLHILSPTAEEDDGSDTETERNAEDDRPPAFPSLLSAQRMKPSTDSRVARVLRTDTELMPPPPPVPNLANRVPGVVGAQPGSTLAVPFTTTKPPNQNKKREKVALAPGHSPLDWAKLKSSGHDLRGVDNLLKIPPSLLKQHNKQDDAWTALNGKVYNITPYLPFHPGGEKELMRVAGRDGSKLFALTHAWVNADFMLDACFVGFLVPEPRVAQA